MIAKARRMRMHTWSIPVAIAALLSLAGCVSSPVPVKVPTAQSVAGLSPSGTVTLTEAVVGGFVAGEGILTVEGKKYPFRLIGSVIGPGGASKVVVTGDVYKLTDIAMFEGVYAQGTGKVGLETSGGSELWLENKAGVIMHLRGASAGISLSLGRDEVFIQMKGK
ncbi:hypothetical protein [Chelatococcus asaccharovorans]|uniref:DUF1134 domain-containing protein n=1 Tax=Chelatococcus asaccharovorans TaxID=28210 RepID=A0A2V3UIP4_9HYPH|nr:hypothetical protein [Chelatococcus asaccharovorans]MBS7706322.1 hypothetical protein [Chelatococcus asaccharovorans]PXW65036.1 hypothetical protein C7450_101797 [Chelatococcus asaccharovorans]CAH1661103.1 conserved exported hypothetical protein [Chelatococcus asaccharovorans]CAH1683575.1 conserved exported hypothetical protein [Chelatococcus asaccharovorans]